MKFVCLLGRLLLFSFSEKKLHVVISYLQLPAVRGPVSVLILALLIAADNFSRKFVSQFFLFPRNAGVIQAAGARAISANACMTRIMIIDT